MEVYLSASCFVSLVASAAEGVPKEVLGLLFGDRIENDERMVISQAIPLQIVKRKRESVEAKRRYVTRVFKLWDDLTAYWPIGDFHSHPSLRDEPIDATPSPRDKKDLKRGELGIIVAVRKNPDRNPLQYDHTGNCIVGNASYFEIEIAAWRKNEKGKLDLLELTCPYIDIINLGHKIGLVPKPGILFGRNTVTSYDELRYLRTLILKYENQLFSSGVSKGMTKIRKEITSVLKRIKEENVK